jgi:hypothetical protein
LTSPGWSATASIAVAITVLASTILLSRLPYKAVAFLAFICFVAGFSAYKAVAAEYLIYYFINLAIDSILAA